MRELEFRAWDVHNLHGMSSPFAIGQDTLFFDDGHTAYPDFVMHEFMQYTGLKDKNGVKIFEGDIVKYCSTHGRIISDVYNTGSCFAIRTTENPLYFNEFYDDYEYSGEPCDHIWIIGNIYENPELLNA